MHFVVGLDVAVGVRAGVRSARTRLTVLRRLLLIDLAEDFVGNLVGLFHLRLNGLDIAAVLCLAQLCNSILDLGLVGGIDLIAQILQSLLDLVSGRVRIVDGLDLLLVLLILIRVLLRIRDGLLDVLLGQVGRSGDGDLLLVAGTQILCGNVHNAVGIVRERYRSG